MRCAGNATPAGDCSAWQTRTVSNVNTYKGNVGIDLDGGALHLSYLRAPGRIGGLTLGESVPALVWEGSAQALRDPQGHVFYSEDSALRQGDDDIGTAAFLSGVALLSMVGAFALSPWFRRRSPRYVPLAIVLADVGVSDAIGGAFIQSANCPRLRSRSARRRSAQIVGRKGKCWSCGGSCPKQGRRGRRLDRLLSHGV